MFKVHHNKFPSVIQNNFTKRHTISLQNTRQIYCYEVPIAKCTITERSIFFHCPKEFTLIMKKGTNWNVSLHAFKRQIKNSHMLTSDRKSTQLRDVYILYSNCEIIRPEYNVFI